MSCAPVPLRRWAERVLFGTSLDDKLWRPSYWSDSDRGEPWGDVQVPGRATALRMATTGEAAAVPTSLELAASRGQLFHFFANHELVAAELMALCLLRFPDAPPAFRRGVAQTLADEQRHLRGYLDTMAASSTTLGQYPLGGFLWRVMAPMADPRDYAAHMALTFEQANLDFARHYAHRLAEAGDDEGAAHLREVYRDEIAHVAHGRVWFQRWRERGPSLLEAHRRALRPPTTLRRARGIGFDRAGRRAAGLPDAYVDGLEHYEASRGRRVTVYELVPTAEHDVCLEGGYSPDASTRQLIDDLCCLPMFVARGGDVVVVPRAPAPGFVARQREAGFEIPQWVDRGRPDARTDVAAVVPWGWGPAARRRLADWIALSTTTPPAAEHDAARLSKRTWQDIGVDVVAGEDDWCFGALAAGQVVTTIDDVVAVANEIAARGYPRAVAKAPWGTAGRSMQRIDRATPTVAQRGWLRRTLDRQGSVVVEPWLEATCDTSIRITVAPDGGYVVDDVGRFVTDARGQYLGAVLGPLSRAVTGSLARVVHGQGRDPGRLRRVVDRVSAAVSARARALGYAGPIGIDGVLARDAAGQVRWRPLVEVNVRPSFGHVVAGLGRQLTPRVPGLWLLLRVDELRPDLDAAAAVAVLDGSLPLQRGPDGRVRGGVVLGGDPMTSTRVLPLALVGRPIPQLLRIVATVAPDAARRVGTALARGDFA